MKHYPRKRKAPPSQPTAYEVLRQELALSREYLGLALSLISEAETAKTRATEEDAKSIDDLLAIANQEADFARRTVIMNIQRLLVLFRGAAAAQEEQLIEPVPAIVGLDGEPLNAQEPQGNA